MLNTIKKYLRIPLDETMFDDEINDLIAACKADLISSGLTILAVDETLPLIKDAIKTYANAHFGPENPDSDKYMASYNAQKANLIVLGDNVGD